MMWSMLANPRAIVTLALVLAFAGVGVGGYFKGRRDANVKHQLDLAAARADAETRAREIEQAKTQEVSDVESNYQKKVHEITSRALFAERELGRLRVKVRPRRDMSQAAPAPRRTDGAPADGTAGPGTGEIDLDGVAAEIVRLGRDLDAAAAKIAGLQELVRSYSDTSGD